MQRKATNVASYTFASPSYSTESSIEDNVEEVWNCRGGFEFRNEEVLSVKRKDLRFPAATHIVVVLPQKRDNR